MPVSEQELLKIIRPMTQSAWTSDYPWGSFKEWLGKLAADFGGIDYCPDFQRGHVWTSEQQTRYVEAAMRNLLPLSAKSVQFNCANWHDADMMPVDLPRGLQCIDGLQRISAVDAWLNDEIKPFGYGLDVYEDTRWFVKRGLNLMFRFHVSIFDYTTRAEVLQHYLDMNDGGTPHSPSEIARVRGLLQATVVRND